MAKVIWRVGKVGIAILFVLLIFGLVFYSAQVYTVAEEIPASEPVNTEAEGLLAQLKETVASRKVEEAKNLSDQIVQIWPESIYAIDALGEVGYLYAFKGDGESVTIVLDQLYAQYTTQPKVTDAIARIARGYIKKGSNKTKVAMAQSIYSEAIAMLPDHPDLVWLHGGVIRCQIFQRDFAQAEAGLEQLWSQHSSADRFVESLIAVGNAYRRVRKFSAQQVLCSQILTELPNDPLAPLVLCDEIRAYIQLDDLATAEHKLDELWAKYSSVESFVAFLSPVRDTYRKAGAFAAHRALCNRILTEFPDDPLAPLVLRDKVGGCRDEVREYIQLDDLATAEQKLGGLWTNYSSADGFVELLSPVRDAFWEVKAFAAHGALCRRVVTEFPDDPLAPTFLAHEIVGDIHCLNMEQVNTKVEELFAKYSHTPEFIDAVYYVCKPLVQRKDFVPLALQITNQALQICGDQDKAIRLLKLRATCYVKTQKGEQIDAVVDEIFQNHSTNKKFARIIDGIASRSKKYDDFDRSIEISQRMLYYTPDIYEQIRAHTNEAMSYVAIGDDIKVEEYLDVICTSYPDSEKLPWAVYVIGEEYYKIGEGLCAEKRIVEALPYYQKAIDIWKQRILDSMPGCDHEAEAYLFSGICYDRLQQHQKAAEYLQKVIHDWPDYRYVGSAYDWYAECLEKMKTKGLVEADIANTQIEETYKVIIEEYPDYLYRTNICRKLGKFYFRNKRWPDAISHYNSLKGEENIPLVEILYSLGRCYEAVGDKVNAITSYTELLETDANKKYRYEVTSRLKSLSN